MFVVVIKDSAPSGFGTRVYGPFQTQPEASKFIAENKLDSMSEYMAGRIEWVAPLLDPTNGVE